MASIVSHHPASSSADHSGGGRAELTPQKALRRAWFTYLTMLAIPAVLFVVTLFTLAGEGYGFTRRDRSMWDVWFIGAVAFLVIAGPAAFFVRSRMFRGYWTGECVAPRAYLSGMIVVWATLELGGIISLVGALMSHSLFPYILPALVAFMMYVALWPSGRAMTCGDRGRSDDPERYEEPR